MIFMNKEHPTKFICIKNFEEFPFLYYVFDLDRKGNTLHRTTYNGQEMRVFNNVLETMFKEGYRVITRKQYEEELQNALDQ